MEDFSPASLRRYIERLSISRDDNSHKISEPIFNPDLAKVQKHVLLPNGLFEFNDIPSGRCLCSHQADQHLFGVNECIAKSDEICLCMNFVDYRTKLLTTNQTGRLLKKTETETDPKLSAYIQFLDGRLVFGTRTSKN